MTQTIKRSTISDVASQILNQTVHSIVFHRADGSTIQQPVNSKFLTTDKGRLKSNGKMVEDLLSISNDLNAKYFTV